MEDEDELLFFPKSMISNKETERQFIWGLDFGSSGMLLRRVVPLAWDEDLLCCKL